MKTVQYTASQLLSCAKCNGEVVICVDELLTALTRPWIVGTVVSTLEQWDVCGKLGHVYGFQYDEAQLADPAYSLVTSDIEGVFCKGCLTDYIDSFGMPSMAYILSLLAPYFDHVCLVTSEAELIAAMLNVDCNHILIGEAFTLTANRTVPVGKSVTYLNGCPTTTNGHVFTFNGPFHTGNYQCFITASGDVLFGPGSTGPIAVEWFGAAADNSNDSTNAINQAIQSVVAGGIIMLLPGIYIISATITVDKEGIIIRGSGADNFSGLGPNKGTILFWDGGADIMMEIDDVNAITLEHFSLDGNSGAATVCLQLSETEESHYHDILVRDADVGIQLGDPTDWTRSVSGQTFSNIIVRNNGVGIKVIGNNTENINFYGGIIFDNDTYGVHAEKGGLLFSGIDSSSNTIADYYIDPPALSSFMGITIEKGFSEASGIFLLTEDFVEGFREKPINLMGCRVSSKDASNRCVYHQSTMPLVMIGNEFGGLYECTAKVGATAGPPIVVDIGNSWDLTSTRPDGCSVIQANRRNIVLANHKLNWQAVGAVTPIVLSLLHSGKTYTNANAAGVIEFQLPSAAPDANSIGTWYQFIRNAAHAIQIQPVGAEIIGAGAAGQHLSMDTDGTVVEVMLVETGVWRVKVYGTVSYA